MKKVDIEIDKAVLNNTTNCLNKFSCRVGDKTNLCDVITSNQKDIVEIKFKPSRSCKYCISLDSASYCHCPTRVEIYNRYKK
jgi:hypothetical protein